MQLQKEKQLVLQTQKTNDSKTNILVSPVPESVHPCIVNDRKRKRRRRTSKRRKDRNSSDKEKNKNVISKQNKASFIFPKVVTTRVPPSKDVVISSFNSMKKRPYSPKSTISNQSTDSSPRLVIANHLYLNR